MDSFITERNTATLQENDSLKGLVVKQFSLTDEDFNTVKVQLIALKLISRSTKKKTRSVSDRNAYWMLTPYGESVMISLRAIKKP